MKGNNFADPPPYPSIVLHSGAIIIQGRFPANSEISVRPFIGLAIKLY